MAGGDFPDPNFTFELGPWGGSATTLATGVDGDAIDLRSIVSTLNREATSKRLDDSSEALVQTSARMSAVAALLGACATAHTAARASAERYLAAAPTLAEVQAKAKAADAARLAMMRTESAAAELAYKVEVSELRAARAQRSSAKAVLEADDQRIAAELQAAVEAISFPALPFQESASSSRGSDAPTDLGHTPPGVMEAAHPLREAKQPGDPGTAPAAVPGTRASSSAPGTHADRKPLTPSVPAPAAMQPQPQQAPQPQQPQTSPAAASPAALSKPSDAKKHTPDTDTPDTAPGVVGAVGTTPAAAAAAPSTPPTPPVTGRSADGLRTAANVTGRSPATNLSAANGITNAKSSVPAGGMPMGRGMMPMVPGMMGPPGQGSGKERKLIIQNAEDAELHGINAVRDAVRGGTILRVDPDPTLPPPPSSPLPSR